MGLATQNETSSEAFAELSNGQREHENRNGVYGAFFAEENSEKLLPREFSIRVLGSTASMMLQSAISAV